MKGPRRKYAALILAAGIALTSVAEAQPARDRNLWPAPISVKEFDGKWTGEAVAIFLDGEVASYCPYSFLVRVEARGGVYKGMSDDLGWKWPVEGQVVQLGTSLETRLTICVREGCLSYEGALVNGAIVGEVVDTNGGFCWYHLVLKRDNGR